MMFCNRNEEMMVEKYPQEWVENSVPRRSCLDIIR
jgi:hypothetical protein